MQMVCIRYCQISLLLRRLKQVDGVAELRCDTTGAHYCGFYNRRYTNPAHYANGGTATALGTSATGFTYTAPSDGTYTFVITTTQYTTTVSATVNPIESYGERYASQCKL
jgi:hypothetical protein